MRRAGLDVELEFVKDGENAKMRYNLVRLYSRPLLLLSFLILHFRIYLRLRRRCSRGLATGMDGVQDIIPVVAVSNRRGVEEPAEEEDQVHERPQGFIFHGPGLGGAWVLS